MEAHRSAGSGAVAAARETSSRLPPALARCPANSAAPHASRYVLRERRTSSGSSFLAAWSSSSGASPPRRCANTISARSRSMRARPSSSSGPASAAARSPRATSNAPAPRLAWAAASARSARRAGSPVSATARCRNAAAAAWPPRAFARSAEQLELTRHVLVGPGGRSSQMPRTTIRIDVPIRDLRQRQVGRPPLRPAGGPVHGRARQRMAERHAFLAPPAIRPSRRPQRARSRGVRRRAAAAADRRPGRPLRRATDVARPRGAVSSRRSVALLDPLREIARLRHPEPAGQLRRRQALGAARAARAGSLVSPRGSCRVLARPTGTASSSRAARGHRR